ncbi:MAG: tRNA lysidine(34) synthetase TilS [Algibacter sp.]
MQERFQKHISRNLHFLKESKLLIAISGGLDSVVLAHLCHKLNLKISFAHCNFNLRGNESDGDQDFVLQLAEDLDLEVFVESFDTEKYAQESKLSIQMAARELRYNWFEDLANQLEFDYILTAHHADDNLETFLINLSRGTGLEGLKGIPEINENIVRPLLSFSREAIIAFAEENKISWREDSSNASTKYMRNKLRHDVIPVLKEMNPQFLQNFNKTQGFLKDSKAIIDDSIQSLIRQGVVQLTENGMKFNISMLKKFDNPKAYLYQLMNGYGFFEWNNVVQLMDAQSGKQLFSKDWRLIKDRDYLLLTEISSEEKEIITISESDKQIETSFGALCFDEVDAVSTKQSNIIYVDKSLLKFPLTLRLWEEGDYFYPLGMSGKKKLSKYFKDEKLSLVDKEHVWLLCSENDMVWVINRRADNRFRVTESTKCILKIELK